MVVLILHMQICFSVEGLSLPVGEWYTSERVVYPNIGWDVNLFPLGAVGCDSFLVFGSLTMPWMFCQCRALHVCLYVLTGMLYTLCRFQLINQRVFRNGSNTLMLFLEWIKLNCSCCTFSIAFDVVLFLVSFLCRPFTHVRFETITRKLWAIFVPRGHLEK